MVPQLPAVMDATRSDGVFTRVKQSGRAGDKKTAESILNDGTFPIEKVDFLKHMRKMSAFEHNSIQQGYQLIDFNGLQIRNFDYIFVLNTSGHFVLTFGSALVIDQWTIQEGYESGHIDKLLAHELAHLNNGDSYVKAAIWFLGKGWVKEYMSPFGIVPENEEEKAIKIHDVVARMTGDVLRFGWKGLAVGVGREVVMDRIAGGGSGVRKYEKEITDYFHEWDKEADALAEQWVGANQYRSYLWDLLENGTSEPFDASPRDRYDASEDRGDPTPRLEVAPELPAPAPVPTSAGTDVEGGMRMLFFILFFGGLFLVSCLGLARLYDSVVLGI